MGMGRLHCGCTERTASQPVKSSASSCGKHAGGGRRGAEGGGSRVQALQHRGAPRMGVSAAGASPWPR